MITPPLQLATSARRKADGSPLPGYISYANEYLSVQTTDQTIQNLEEIEIVA